MTRSVILLCITASQLLSGVLCSWEFHSYHEAFTEDNERCVGECEQGRCVYNRDGGIKPCHSTKNETKAYTSHQNYVCQSNCDKFEKSEEWCLIGDGYDKWDYCTRDFALKGRFRHTTENKHYTCSDECVKHHKNSKYWCHTSSSWEYCNVDEKIFVPEYPTKAETRCVNPCMFDDDERSTFCYDNEDSWKRCYFNPHYEQVLHALTIKLRDKCIQKFGTYTRYRYSVRCSNNLSISKHNDECDLDVRAIAERHKANNPSHQERVVEPQQPITEDANPILSYTMMPMRRVRFEDNENVLNVDLPLVLEAQLTRHTLLSVDSKIEQVFPRYVTNHYKRMNPKRKDNTISNKYDELGYILGPRLGGPVETYNIFPQKWYLNHGSDSSWYEMEQHMVDYLRDRNDRYIEFLAVIGYLQDSNGTLITRPDHIGIRLRFYQNNTLTDRYGYTLVSFKDNETEDMYFSNDPDDDCIVDW